MPAIPNDGRWVRRGGRPCRRAVPSGQSVQGDSLALHYYDRRLNGAFQLALVELEWDDEGWPTAHW